MTPTTEQLKDLLDKVTPGDWAWRDVGLYDEGYTYAYLTNGVSTRCRDDTECIVGSSEWLDVNEHDATLIALAPTLAAEVVRLREALGDIACQKKSTEFATTREYMNADFEGGYDECVSRARIALDATSDA